MTCSRSRVAPSVHRVCRMALRLRGIRRVHTSAPTVSPLRMTHGRKLLRPTDRPSSSPSSGSFRPPKRWPIGLRTRSRRANLSLGPSLRRAVRSIASREHGGSAVLRASQQAIVARHARDRPSRLMTACGWPAAEPSMGITAAWEAGATATTTMTTVFATKCMRAQHQAPRHTQT